MMKESRNQSNEQYLLESKPKKSKIYFNGLDSLRFLAAFVVIIHHVEQIKSLYGYKNYFGNIFIHNIGAYGVTFFFALSGFLITYLLFVEQESAGTINIKNFYIRRTLRIWPLYLLLGILTLLVLPQIPQLHVPVWQNDLNNTFLTQVFLYFTFLQTIAVAFFGTIPHANQVWSVGVEEQFYLLWPLLIKYFRNAMKAIIGVITIYFIIKLTFIVLLNFYQDNQSIYDRLYSWSYLVNLTRIDCMAIGAIAADWLYQKKPILMLFYSRFAQVLIYTITAIFLITGGIGRTFLYNFNQEIFAVLSTSIIINIAINKKTIVSINNPAIDYLGKISYGLYMYHTLCIAISLYLVKEFSNYSLNGLTGNAIVYVLTMILTIIFSAISYQYFEKPFIKLKHKYSTIVKEKS